MNYYFQIWGEVSDARLAESPPHCWQDEEGRFATLDAEPLAVLGVMFREYLWERVPEAEEWDSTSSVFEYLAMDVVEVMLGGAQPDDVPRMEWTIEMLFNGCGGMAEVSSLLAAHWAEIWFQDQRKAIARDVLSPFGFSLSEEQAEFEWPPFVPVGGGSYAVYRPERMLEEGDSPFELNVALADSLEDTDRLLAALTAEYGERVQDGRCHCQLCMPGWDPSAVDCRRL